MCVVRACALLYIFQTYIYIYECFFVETRFENVTIFRFRSSCIGTRSSTRPSPRCGWWARSWPTPPRTCPSTTPSRSPVRNAHITHTHAPARTHALLALLLLERKCLARLCWLMTFGRLPYPGGRSRWFPGVGLHHRRRPRIRPDRHGSGYSNSSHCFLCCAVVRACGEIWL